MKPTVISLTEFASTVDFESLPTPAIVEMKRIVLDSIGCALAALSADKGKRVVRVAREMGRGNHEASVIGTDDVLSVSAAAFANAELINALDFDALTVPPGHVVPYVLPAVLATGERGKVSGKSFLRALAVGLEVSARFGLALANYRDPKPGEQISFPPVTGSSSAIFGGTLGVAMLRGQDSIEMSHSLGMAGRIAPAQSQTKWAHTVPATDEKYLMSGWMAQAELLAVLLAEQGYRGDVGVLDGDFGFWRYMGSSKWNPEPLLKNLGDVWIFPESIMYKYYPACGISNTALDCLVHLLDQHKLRPDEITEITAYCDPHGAVLPLWTNQTVKSPGDAQNSVPYAVSMLVHGVEVGTWHDDTTMRDQRYLKFMQKVSVKPHPDYDQAASKDPRCRLGGIKLYARGTSFEYERLYRKGSQATPESTMSDVELVEKFMQNSSRVLTPSRADRIVQEILQLEKNEDLTVLASMMRNHSGI